jgi:imidazolonepropionase
MKLAPEEALVAATVNAANVLGRVDRIGRLEPGFAADMVLLDAPDWRHVAYHLAGDIVHTVVESGAVAFRRTA